jgi:NAD(P)-dependent dehydrogenase (short-subunit alcohol dehydrogenase family)
VSDDDSVANDGGTDSDSIGNDSNDTAAPRRRTVVVTGASSGIGEVAARELAEQGFRVAVVGRDLARTRAVADRVGGDAFIADFERFDDVRRLASELLERLDRIDVLANNAGGLYAEREITVDGHERTLQTNFLAPLLLTSLLRERLVSSASDEAGGSEDGASDGEALDGDASDTRVPTVRVVNTASVANLFGSLHLDDLDWAARPWRGGWQAYGTSKLAVILGTRVLAEKLTGTGVTAYSFHPGSIVTRFGAQSPLLRLGNTLTRGHYGRTAADGAAPLVALAAAEHPSAAPGTYFDRFTANGRGNSQARDPQLARDLWSTAVDLLGVADVWPQE